MHPYSHCDATIDANARVPYGTLDMKSTLSNKVQLFDLQSFCYYRLTNLRKLLHSFGHFHKELSILRIDICSKLKEKLLMI